MLDFTQKHLYLTGIVGELSNDLPDTLHVCNTKKYLTAQQHNITFRISIFGFKYIFTLWIILYLGIFRA